MAQISLVRRVALFFSFFFLALFMPLTVAAAAGTDKIPDTGKQATKKTPASVKGTQPKKNAKGIPAKKKQSVKTVTSLRDMFEEGTVDGNLRFDDFTTHNAFFTPGENQNTGTYGGKLRFTTATLHGFSLQIAAYAQRGVDHSRDPKTTAASTLAPNISTLGEAYLQWRSDDFRVRVGNQRLKAPFTSTTDYRIIPPLFQGVVLRAGDKDNYLTAMRIFRFKSYINDSFDRTTTYNTTFSPFGVNTTQGTNGFWALGGGRQMDAGPVSLKGQAWFFNYRDYANMFYTDGQVTKARGPIKPFVGFQFIRETDSGRALVGKVDHHTYGAQFGLKHHSLTATLNFDYIPHENGTFLNGSLVAPYEHNVASGPYFAQPFLTSTEDLGSGEAYSAEVKGAAFKNTFLGARYSYMDLVPQAGADSIGQSEYLVYGIYNFKGALDGFSVTDFFGYQTQKVSPVDFWQNRLQLQYSF